MNGQICGLSFDAGMDGVAILYLATIESLAYQSLQILERLQDNGVRRPQMITVIGGLAQNRLYCQVLSDVCSIPVLVPASPETTVILGSAILGASNTSEFKEMSFEQLIGHFGESFNPTINNNSNTIAKLLTPNASTAKFHQKKYKVFKSMVDDQIKYRNLMEN